MPWPINPDAPMNPIGAIRHTSESDRPLSEASSVAGATVQTLGSLRGGGSRTSPASGAITALRARPPRVALASGVAHPCDDLRGLHGAGLPLHFLAGAKQHERRDAADRQARRHDGGWRRCRPWPARRGPRKKSWRAACSNSAVPSLGTGRTRQPQASTTTGSSWRETNRSKLASSIATGVPSSNGAPHLPQDRVVAGALGVEPIRAGAVRADDDHADSWRTIQRVQRRRDARSPAGLRGAQRPGCRRGRAACNQADVTVQSQNRGQIAATMSASTTRIRAELAGAQTALGAKWPHSPASIGP